MMRPENTALRWIYLALLGAVSGLLCRPFDALPSPLEMLWIGGIFGIALASYLILHKGFRDPAKIAKLIVASVLSFFFAVLCSLWLPRLPLGGDLSMAATGGLIGGFLIVGSVIKLFPSSGRNDLAMVFAGSSISGLLGIVGWQLGPSLGKMLWTIRPNHPLPGTDSFNSYSLYPIWQTGMALFIGFVAQRRSDDEPTPMQTHH